MVFVKVSESVLFDQRADSADSCCTVWDVQRRLMLSSEYSDPRTRAAPNFDLHSSMNWPRS